MSWRRDETLTPLMIRPCLEAGLFREHGHDFLRRDQQRSRVHGVEGADEGHDACKGSPLQHYGGVRLGLVGLLIDCDLGRRYGVAENKLKSSRRPVEPGGAHSSVIAIAAIYY